MGNGVVWRWPPHAAPKRLWRLQPTWVGFLREEERLVAAVVAIRLSTIHPNPGPNGRDKSETGKEARRGRRKEKRKERREARLKERQVGKEELVVVTWNVQRMSVEERRKRKARAVAEYARKSGWDVVLLSEIRAEKEGVVWMGEEEERVAIVHSEKAGVLLRGDALKWWCEEGMKKKTSKRQVSVKVKGVVCVATYMPVSVHGNEEEVEMEYEALTEHVNWAKGDELLVVGGDWNAHVGADGEKKGVSGKFGLRSSNQRGRDMLEWCEANGLTYVNSFHNHRKRGTWLSNLALVRARRLRNEEPSKAETCEEIVHSRRSNIVRPQT